MHFEDVIGMLTKHAHKRMSQRNIGKLDVDAALTWGTEVRRAGAIFLHVRRNDARRARRLDGADLSGAVDVVVVLDHEGWIKTVYRTEDHKRIRRKAKRSRVSRIRKAS